MLTALFPGTYFSTGPDMKFKPQLKQNFLSGRLHFFAPQIHVFPLTFKKVLKVLYWWVGDMPVRHQNNQRSPLYKKVHHWLMPFYGPYVKGAGVGCHSLLQGSSLTQGSHIASGLFTAWATKKAFVKNGRWIQFTTCFKKTYFFKKKYKTLT